MKNCNEIKEMISGYIEKELNDIETMEFEKHLESCRECSNDLEEMKTFIALCKDIPSEELPQDFQVQLHEKLISEKAVMEDRKKKFYLVRKYAAICSTVAAVLAIAVILKGFPWNSSISAGSKNSTKDKIVYRKEQPKKDAPETTSSPTVSDKKTEPDQTQVTSRKIAGVQQKHQANTDIKEKAIGNGKQGKTNISPENKTFEGGSVLRNDLKAGNEAEKSKKASGNDTQNADVMFTLSTQDNSQKYEIKSVNISISANGDESMEKIKESAPSYGAEMITGKDNETASETILSAASIQNTEIKLKVPNTSYQQFIDFLNSSFPLEGIQVGKLNITDVSGQMKEYQDQVNSLSQESTNDSDVSPDTAQKDNKSVSEELTKTQGEMDQLKNETEYTTVVITFEN